MDSRLDAILRKVGSIRPRGAAICRSVKAPWRSADDTLQRSTLVGSLERAQRAAVPAPRVIPPSFVLGGPRKAMMEQVEADIASLMAGKVPSIFGGLTIKMAVVAYPIFQEELLGLPSKGLLERIIAESV